MEQDKKLASKKVKRHHIPKTDIRLPPKSKAFAIDTEPQMPQLASLMLFCAKRGSGKSVSMSNIVRMYKEQKSVQRVFVLSPTFWSNKDLFAPLVDDDEEFDDVYTDPNNDALRDIQNKINEMRDEWEEYLTEKKMYELLMKKIKRAGLSDITEDELLRFFIDGEFKPPDFPYKDKNGKPVRPHSALIIDDCQGTPVFKPSSLLANLCLRHRHTGPLKKGGALGVSIFLAVQTYKSQSAGLGRSIRTNLTHIVLWPTKLAELKRIAEELSEIPPNVFKKAYQILEDTHDPHQFLFLDLHPKEHHPSKIRLNYNQFLEIADDGTDDIEFQKLA